MIKRKLSIIAIFMIVLLNFIGFNQVQAVGNYTCDIIITGDKNEIKQGEDVVYEIKATNVNTGTGIVAFQTRLEFDSDVFDYSATGNDEDVWKVVNIDNNLIITKISNDAEASLEDQIIAKIILTAKKDAKEGEQLINFKDIQLTNDDLELIEPSDQSKTIKVLKSVENINRNENEKESISLEVFEVALIIIAVIMIILAIAILRKYKKEKNEL